MDDNRYFGLTPTQLNLVFFTVVGAVAVAGFVYAGGVGAVREYLGDEEPTTQPAVQATATAEPTEEPEAPAGEPAQPASTECSQLAVGCDALVTNTGTVLNLRDTPSTNGSIISRLQDGTTVAMKGGPTQSDGYVWWQILASGSLGWAAEGDASGTKWLVPVVVGSSEIGPEVVWDALGAWWEDRSGDLTPIQNDLTACDWDDRECTASVMASYSARAEAIAFHRGTGLFAISFQDAGKVDVVGTFNPTGANSNWDTVLVNGSPRILVADKVGLALANYPPYTEIATAIDIYSEYIHNPYYPDMGEFIFTPWTSDITLKEITASPTGGQAFIFRVPLTDGCHSCPIGYEGSVAIDFSPEGTYDGWRALEPCANLGMYTYVDVGAELCETQPCVPLISSCYVWIAGDHYDSPGGEVVYHGDRELVAKVKGLEGQDWWLVNALDGGSSWITADSIIRPVEVGGLPCATGTAPCIDSP